MSTISISTTLTQGTLTTFPIIINGGTLGTPTVITLGGNITLDANDKYFIIGSEYVTFNGAGYIVTIANVTGGYPGLIRNGTGTNAYDNITVENVGVVTTSGSTLTTGFGTGGGWVGQLNFGKNSTATTAVLVNNCYSTGLIGNYSGGITGRSSSGTVTNCYSTGASGQEAGGITGGYSSGNAINCYSTGTIGNQAGGIMGYSSSGSATNCYSTGTIDIDAGGITGSFATGNAINCYSTGTIGQDSGGITGRFATGNATNCYSTGAIGTYAGGIMGKSASGSATNCYSTGTIGQNAGGITGQSSSASATNCYSTGTIDRSAGGITGKSATGSATNCYTIGTITTSGNGIRGTDATTTVDNCTATGDNIWSNNTSNSVLTGDPSYSSPTYTNGAVWTDIAPTTTNTPYKLTTFNASPYTPSSKTISLNTAGNSGTNTDLGTYSIVAVKHNNDSNYSTNTNTYSSVISIDTASGQLTFASSDVTKIYTILVYVYDDSNGYYSISDYVLTVGVGCFLKGTKIAKLVKNTIVQCEIENLNIGDIILTISNTHTMAIKAIKSFDVDDINLIRKIKANRIDINVPNDDLYVTKTHGILLGENNYNCCFIKQPKQITKIDDYFKLTAENFNKSEKIKGKVVLPIMCYNILLHDENKKEVRCGIYANGLLVESMRPDNKK